MELVLTIIQHSIDVEAAIRNGKLDVGLFGPTTMLPLDSAERVMTEIREHFLALMKQTDG